MTHEESVEILATYALDAVDGDEREALQQHLAECPRCRAELDGLREVATALGNSVEPLPEGLWSSISSRLPMRHDDELPPMPQLVPDVGSGDAEQPTTRARRSFPTAPRGRMATLGVVAVAAAAVVTVLAVSLVHADNRVSQLRNAIGEAAPSAVVSALGAPGHKVVNLDGTDHRMVAQFVVVPDGRGYLVSSMLPTLSAGHTYQLWGVIHGQPISLGLLGPSPNQATFTMAGSQSASRLAITTEPAGGSVVPSRALVAQGTI